MRIFYLCLFWLITLPGWTQNRCATESLLSNHNRKESLQEFEQWLKVAKNGRLKTSQTNNSSASIYRVPIVFHIIHDGSSIGNGSNISDKRIMEQVEILNNDFRRLNTDASETPAEFLPVAADTEIEFVLAKQDPEGLPTTGIIRQRGSKDSYHPVNDEAVLTAESFWDQDYYVNIWVTDLNGFLGAAQFPFSTIDGSETKNYKSSDGLMLDYEYVGINPSAPSFDSYGRTTVHEMGHYLGLKHIWGDGGCSFDDFCEDTPRAENATFDCPGTKFSCSSNDMIQNYMDYTDDVCMNLFTVCQKERMRTVLEMSPRRASLLTSPGLKEPIMVSNDLGIRSIVSPDQMNCETAIIPSVEVRNYGTNVIESYSVNLFVNGVSIETLNVENSLNIGETTVLTFDALTLSGNSSDSLSIQIEQVNGSSDQNNANDIKTIVINPFEQSVVPYYEDFESNEPIYSYMENGTSSKWMKTTAPSDDLGNMAAYLPFHNQETNFGYRDIFITPTFDLSALTSVQLDFEFAYASRPNELPDGLVVVVSTDCGASFPKRNIVFERYGRSLATSSASDFSFVPTRVDDWEKISLNLTEFAGEENVQIGFMGVNAGGNNIYLDEISLTSANLLAYDIGIKSIDNLPLASCATSSRVNLQMKNFGYETINTINIKSTINGVSQSYDFNRLSLRSGQTEFINISISDQLTFGTNEIIFEIGQINGQTDGFDGNNVWTHYGLIEDSEELIPLREDFEPMNWQIVNTQGISFLEVVDLDRNDVLATKSFDNDTVGQSILVSPTILTGDYKTGGLRFDYSYGQRLGFNDNLKVMLSVNCGKTYDKELLSLNAAQLAVTNSNEEWIPESDDDWKQAFIDLSEHMIWPELRIAFVFTNGNGNKLYLDNIDVLTTNDPDLPEFENPVMVYPNPAFRSFKVALNLQHKQVVNIRLMDMTGHVIFDKPFANSINQTLNFEAPSQSGFYLLQVTGENNLNQIKRIFIKR
ncbi:MAG: choice-of-anchor J domain-containing protein [Cyclobacteriaceae bacterium]